MTESTLRDIMRACVGCAARLATIPKAFGFEAATHFTSILLGGSHILIDVYRDVDGFSADAAREHGGSNDRINTS